ncbi:cell division cycle-associated 7-like protein [Coccinella septempunctata]|uniref:cell division cycle-associated 7-like protein n=1 Tax=Coccinella septempunctata TaxID=41139 RepID=UPI001D07BABB|nr:cell division cycle-associated 7-like protein [Coccinella septempunctata]
MNITPKSMEDLILKNMGGHDIDPHLKKLLAELNTLKEQIYGDKTKNEKEVESTITRKESSLEVKKKIPQKRRKNTGDDPAFRSSIAMFTERRKSDRLSGKLPRFNFMEDIDELENRSLFSNGQLKYSKERIQRRSFSRQQQISCDRVILEPEEITPEMLADICYKVTDKVYDKINGSSCHQCRQKTLDTKTICRNLDCFGVRGQFCGPCAKNRYGVDIADALLDPYWSCFVCQGICNCSFCRSRQGKRPTGILAPIAKREGHDSVKEFLDELKVKMCEEDDYSEYMQDPESILGFINHDTVCTVGGNETIFCGTGTEWKAPILFDIIDSLENNSCFSGFITESTVNASKNKLNSIIESLSEK